jgi:hypothetical protein
MTIRLPDVASGTSEQSQQQQAHAKANAAQQCWIFPGSTVDRGGQIGYKI